MILEGCPGAARLKTPTLEEKICPVCGNIIEIFSVDTEVACERCGFVAYNDALSCAQWCQYAEKCLGPELYQKVLAQKKPTGRNVMAVAQKTAAIHPMG